MTDKDLDAFIVLRVQQGDLPAFNLLVLKYQRRLLRVVSRLVHDAADAEDVVQETFVKAYRALPNFRGDAAFYTWLFRIGVNVAKNFLVTKNRKAGISLQLLAREDDNGSDEHAVAEAACPSTALANKQTVIALDQALDAMPTQLRTAIVLYEIEGLSYEEIGTVMRCPVGTVRSRIFRARELIAAKLFPMVESAPLRMASRACPK